MTGTGARSAVEWLASVAPDPEACRWEWERNPLGVALLPAGRSWDVLILPAELGYPTLDVLTRLIDCPGPVLADSGDSRMGFFVPSGTVARWLGSGVRGAGHGTWIVVPCPGRAAGGMRWLIPPDGSGTLTDPSLLELAMHEAAAVVAAGTAKQDPVALKDSAGGARSDLRAHNHGKDIWKDAGKDEDREAGSAADPERRPEDVRGGAAGSSAGGGGEG